MEQFFRSMNEAQLTNVLNRRNFLVGTFVVTGGALLAACSNETPAGDNKTNKDYKIAVIGGMAQVPFYEMIRKGSQDEGTKQGVSVEYQAPTMWDPKEQSQLIDAVIAKGVDAIVISPCHPAELKNPLQTAHDKGLVVVTIDTFIGDGNYEDGDTTFPIAYIGSDNKKGGTLAGDTLISSIGGKGKVLVLGTSADVSTIIERIQGFEEAVSKTNGQVTIVSKEYDGGQISQATQLTSTIIQKHPDLVGIFGATAFSAEGAAVAVKSANKAGSIKIAHFDASPEGVTDMRNGLVDILIGQKPKDMGKLGVQFAIKVLNGETNIPKKQMTDYIIITKDNLDTPEAQESIYTNS